MTGIAAASRPVPAAAAWADSYFTVGVTGTNGKTSTTHLVAAIFRAADCPTALLSTLGFSTEGPAAPLVAPTRRAFFDALQAAAVAGCRHAAIELTSKALRGGYALAWRFDLAIFTNLSRDHIEEHGSWEHYLASKAQLFVHLGPGRSAVLNACDEAALLIDRVIPPDVHRLWYGAASRGSPRREPALYATALDVSIEGTRLQLAPSELAERLGGELHLSLVGEVFGENALAAAGAALVAGVAPEAVHQGLASCSVLPGRFEVMWRRPLVVLDYAHTPDALGQVLDTGRRIARAGRLIVVFGAGGGADPDKRGPMGEAVGGRADLAFVTNDNPRSEDPLTIARAVAAGCERGGRALTRIICDRTEAIEAAITAARKDDVVIVAGRGHDRGMRFATDIIDYSDVDALRQLLGRTGQSSAAPIGDAVEPPAVRMRR